MLSSQPQLSPKTYAKLLLLVVILGMVSAVITFAFIFIVHRTGALLWEETAAALAIDMRLFTLLVCTLGGLLVGLLVKFFGDHNAIFAELMQEFGKTGRFNYRHAPGIVVTAFVSLVAGGSLGPEAPLADACGGMGTWLADRFKMNETETRTLGYGGLSGMLAAFITNPFGGALLGLESSQTGASGNQLYLWSLFPSLLSSAIATVVFVALSGSFFARIYAFPEFVPSWSDLFWAVPLGLVGGIAGWLFTFTFSLLRRLMLPMKKHVVLRGLLGGLSLGILGALLPLTLFSGEAQTSVLVAQAAQIGFVMLCVLAGAKLFMTSLLLASGWKGGYIFPIMFAGVALGMAANLLFPHLQVAVAVSATLAGVLVASLRAPLFSAFFTLALVQVETAPVVAVAVVVSAMLNMLLAVIQARRTQALAQTSQT